MGSRGYLWERSRRLSNARVEGIGGNGIFGQYNAGVNQIILVYLRSSKVSTVLILKNFLARSSFSGMAKSYYLCSYRMRYYLHFADVITVGDFVWDIG